MFEDDYNSEQYKCYLDQEWEIKKGIKKYTINRIPYNKKIQFRPAWLQLTDGNPLAVVALSYIIKMVEETNPFVFFKKKPQIKEGEPYDLYLKRAYPYVEGLSWEEILRSKRGSINTALGKISSKKSTKISQDQINLLPIKPYIQTYVDIKRVTIYEVNVEKIKEVILSIEGKDDFFTM